MIIKINEMNEKEKMEAIRKIQKMILEGKVIICGTDTLYGICVNALDENAVKKVYEIKKREFGKYISISLKDKEDIEKYAYVNDVAKKIIDKFMPGPITTILKKKDVIPDIVAEDYIGIRVPDNDVVRELAIVPLTSTSANISGEESPTSVDEISEEIKKNVDVIVDTGKCKYSKPSTIIKIYENGEVELIREGAIPFKEILEVL
ncbi:L-threonylcarbamoyladenylate synthase [Methanotorris formicicus]|uniref:L-threonylcarbamoyladenylate synthase n=1 Tax=Methanotorris formicicus Mc-S-70 TaxID=647171 RepID=H1L0L9_9EURY|nr:L-threonylcarbamoyladenylate synthase [Methanotorris formicicus]EHP84636.1 Sua5/YciO/YrdC/YwlC family protein [Methanotorris formicicus Mc-S-70]